jgi:hypothetical protein
MKETGFGKILAAEVKSYISGCGVYSSEGPG